MQKEEWLEIQRCPRCKMKLITLKGNLTCFNCDWANESIEE